jgi:hypothetical protein
MSEEWDKSFEELVAKINGDDPEKSAQDNALREEEIAFNRLGVILSLEKEKSQITYLQVLASLQKTSSRVIAVVGVLSVMWSFYFWLS